MATMAAISQPAAVVASGTHLRAAMGTREASAVFLVALLPPAIMAVYNTGLQANLAMARMGVTSAPGWRGQLIGVLGTGYDPSSWSSAAMHGAIYFLPVLLVTTAVGAFWSGVFALVRGRPAGPGILGAAAVFALMLPPTVPLWLTALGMFFGIVLAREIFGGFGRNVVNPAIAGLAFLHISYPAEMMAPGVWVPVDGYVGVTPLELAAQGGHKTLAEAGVTWMDAFLGLIPGAFGETSALACVLGAALLVWTGVASWRVLGGLAVGAIAAAIGYDYASDGAAFDLAFPWAWHLVLGGLAFGAVYLATDPVTSAMTDPGRWAYGLLVGVLAILIRLGSPTHPEGIVFAILLGSIFAPTIDRLVMWLDIRRRARRYAR